MIDLNKSGIAEQSESTFEITGMTGDSIKDQSGKIISDLQQLHAEINRVNKAKLQSQLDIDEMRDNLATDTSISPEDYNQKMQDSLEEYYASPKDAVNYRAINTTLGIGISELHGERITQEDRVKAGALPGFADIEEPERNSVLINTVKILHEHIANAGIGNDRGSTLCSIIILGNKIYSLNLGDSTAFVAKLGGNDIDVKQLNDIAHPEKRIKGVLAVKEALGDCDFESDGNEEGVTHIPSLKIETIDLKDSEKALIVVGCDGMTESVLKANKNKSDAEIQVACEDWLKSNLQTIHHEAPHEIAARLVQTATVEKSKDNISSMVAVIDPNEKDAKYLTVFDGHGGDEVSEAAHQLFEPVLHNQIQLAALRSVSQPLAEKYSELILISHKDKKTSDVGKSFEKFNLDISSLINNLGQDAKTAKPARKSAMEFFKQPSKDEQVDKYLEYLTKEIAEIKSRNQPDPNTLRK